jgi:hypothetical protein
MAVRYHADTASGISAEFAVCRCPPKLIGIEHDAANSQGDGSRKLIAIHPRKIAVNALQDKKQAEKIVAWLQSEIDNA